VKLSELYGTDLSSRHRASELRREIVQRIKSGESVRIDVGGVRTLSDSFADELFAVITVEHGVDWFRDNVSVENATPAIRQTILEAIHERLSSASA